MGRQINFYLHPDDYQDFEDLIKKTAEILFLPYYHYNNKISTVVTTIPVDLKKDGFRIYIVRKQDFGQMRLEHIEKFGYWLIADNHLPVLHYDLCRFENGKLMRGRLYFQPSFVRDMQWVNKSEDFVSWADSIIKTARRKLKKYKFDIGGREFSEYVGKHAAEWLDKIKEEKQIDDSTLISM